MTTQLPLFETAAEQQAQSWLARFDRAAWPVEFECGLGPVGTVIQGWVCPACGKVEPTTYTLLVNHGFDPECEAVSAGSRLRQCVSMSLRAAQRQAATP